MNKIKLVTLVILVLMFVFNKSVNASLDSIGKGNKNAPVTITVFFDFQDPYSMKLQPTLEEVLKAYPTDVRINFINFPLPHIHKQARNAVKAALAARDQGKYWDMHDILFKNYNKLTEDKFTELAEQIGLDVRKFTLDFKSNKYDAQINEDITRGSGIGVKGTPTIIINGKLQRGRSLNDFKNSINKILNTNKAESEVTLKMDKCKGSYRHVKGIVPLHIDLSNETTTRNILKEAAYLAIQECPVSHKKRFNNIDVDLEQGGKHAVSARNYANDRIAWFEYSNKPLNERLKRENKKRREIQKKQRAERERLEAERKRIEIKNRQDESQNLFDKFTKKSRIQDWPSIEELFSNPFIYEGNKIGIVAYFHTMRTASEAYFMRNGKRFIVSKIPNGLFRNKVKVLLAGRVLGKKEALPHLNFVNAHICEDNSCDEILFWSKNK